MENKICKICGIDFQNYKTFSIHLKNKHELNAKEYHDKYLIKGKCLECSNDTSFKNLNIGYRKFCSVKCLNINKSKDQNFLKRISDSQKGIPRKKHTEETKKLISDNSKKMWKDPEIRSSIMKIMTTEEFRSSQSKKASESQTKYTSIIDGIRCESKAEETFVLKCKKEGIKIERFHDDGRKSFDVNNRKRLPDFILDNVIIDVKDFHPWFKNELFSGYQKYKDIQKICNEKGYIYLLWFKKYGYMSLEKLENINTTEKLKEFIKTNKK